MKQKDANKKKNRKELMEEFLKNLEKSKGNINYAAIKTGIARATIYRWMEIHREFKEKVYEIKANEEEKIKELAELKLYKAIAEGNLTAIIFYLKTRHPEYSIKQSLQLEGKIKIENSLSKEERKLLETALNYAIGSRKNKTQNNTKSGI